MVMPIMNRDEKVDSLEIYVLAEDCASYSSLFWAQFGASFLSQDPAQARSSERGLGGVAR